MDSKLPAATRIETTGTGASWAADATATAMTIQEPKVISTGGISNPGRGGPPPKMNKQTGGQAQDCGRDRHSGVARGARGRAGSWSANG